jgi:dTDP-glucose 4,6-dehydratase
MNIAITGGAGFIGSHLAEALLDQHHRVTIIDRFSIGSNSQWVDYQRRGRGLRVLVHDVREPLDLSDFDQVFHLAAESHVCRSMLHVTDTWATNVSGTVAVLESARKAGVPVVHVSTDEVYGETYIPVAEDGHFQPTSPYAASKAAGDLACQSAFHTFGQDVRIVRPGNAYGARQHSEKVIPKIRSATATNPFTVHGNGSQVRQWTKVQDIVAGLLLVASSGQPGEAYNCSSESELSIKEVLELAGNPPHTYVPDPRGSVSDFCYRLVCTKLRGLGWNPIGATEGLGDFLGL